MKRFHLAIAVMLLTSVGVAGFFSLAQLRGEQYGPKGLPAGKGDIELLAPQYDGSISIEQGLLWKRTVRAYQDEPLTLAGISQLLWAAQGITEPTRGLRTRRFKYLNNLFPELEFPPASDLYASDSWHAILRREDGMMGRRRVRDYLHRRREELYDLAEDPNELNNLAGDPSHSETLSRMRRELLAFRKRTKDPWLILLNYERGST